MKCPKCGETSRIRNIDKFCHKCGCDLISGRVNNRSARPRGTDLSRVIQVIETLSLRGRGTEEDKCRMVRQYWSLEGKMLAEHDPWAKEK